MEVIHLTANNASALLINDSAASNTQTYSSNRIEDLLDDLSSGIATINDGAPSPTSVWSSSKTNTTILSFAEDKLEKVPAGYANRVIRAEDDGSISVSSLLITDVATVTGVTAALATKAALVHDHTIGQITDFPSQDSQSGKLLSTNGTTLSWVAAPSSLPPQDTHSGKFLTTNGTAASWATITKSTVGLSNVDNTSDADKPISTAVATALAGKEDRSNFYQSVSQAIDWGNGRRQRMDAGSNLALTFTGGKDGDFLFLEITAIGGADRLITLPVGVWGAFTYNRFLVPSGKSVAISGYKSGSIFKLFPGAEAGLLT